MRILGLLVWKTAEYTAWRSCGGVSVAVPRSAIQLSQDDARHDDLPPKGAPPREERCLAG
jgi:hypothetical protein